MAFLSAIAKIAPLETFAERELPSISIADRIWIEPNRLEDGDLFA